MGRIHLLDSHTIGQIRAGEVIERPASVVKELVENSIDAGAHSISVRITGGGITEIVVQDDGQGMNSEDAQLAVQRHATSKLTSSADLFALSTLGFRGEGLASIAAVTHLELLTREPAAVEGARVQIAGDAPMKMTPAAAPPGTTVTVRQLFFNTPPRRAFLKSPTSEGNQIEEMLVGLALSRPEIRFLFTWDQRVVFDALPQDTLAGRVRAVLGKDWTERLIPVAESEALSVESESASLDSWAPRTVTEIRALGNTFSSTSGPSKVSRYPSPLVVDTENCCRKDVSPSASFFLTRRRIRWTSMSTRRNEK